VIRAIPAMLIGITAAHTAGAQSVVATADSLLQRGVLERAESLYYDAARLRPRDPAARSGLARYLAGRGKSRVAVTLYEEAMRFGGDSTSIGADLAPLYLGLWQYRSLLGLQPAVVGGAERDRARWLQSHPTRMIAPDSLITVFYQPSPDSNGRLGRMTIRINGRSVDALIAVNTSGIVVSDSVATATRLRRFTARPTARAAYATLDDVAAADSIGLGRLTFTNFPARVAQMSTPAIIGTDVLGRLAPTFDPGTGRMVLRVSGSVPSSLPGDRFPTWSSATDLKLLQGGDWISVGQRQIAQMLGGRVWTLDAKSGQIVLSR
jgi:hypothetical protein